MNDMFTSFIILFCLQIIAEILVYKRSLECFIVLNIFYICRVLHCFQHYTGHIKTDSFWAEETSTYS